MEKLLKSVRFTVIFPIGNILDTATLVNLAGKLEVNGMTHYKMGKTGEFRRVDHGVTNK